MDGTIMGQGETATTPVSQSVELCLTIDVLEVRRSFKSEV